MKSPASYYSNHKYLVVLIVSVIIIGGIAIALSNQFNQDSTSITTASYAAPVLGVMVDPKLQIFDVEEGSAAEAAGLKRGDVLTALDKVKVSTNLEMKELFRDKVQKYMAANKQTDFSAGVIGPQVTLSFTRGTQEFTVIAAVRTPIKTGKSSGNPAAGPTVTAAPASLDYF